MQRKKKKNLPSRELQHADSQKLLHCTSQATRNKDQSSSMPSDDHIRQAELSKSYHTQREELG